MSRRPQTTAEAFAELQAALGVLFRPAVALLERLVDRVVGWLR